VKYFCYFILGLILLLSGCSLSEGNPAEETNSFHISLVQRISLTVPEPSGLALSADSSFLWTVSDGDSRVYALNFDGSVIRSFPVGEASLDLEGVCSDPDGMHLWLVNEASRELIHCDLNGNILQKKRIIEGNDNSGLEGIARNPADSILYLLKEKNPGQLLICDKELNLQRTITLDFADDYSGLAWSEKFQALWIISDKSKSLTLFAPDSGILGTVNFFLDKAEGIAIDERNQKLWLISDSRAELLHYAIEW
jgi:uncharacterized protein YjiK